MGVPWGRLTARRSSGASFYSATRLVPRWWIRTTASRRSVVVRATWRRRALADGLEDRLGLYRGQLARCCGSGGAVHGRSPLWPAASRRGRPDGGAVGRQGRLCGEGGGGRAGCEWGEAGAGAGRRPCDAAARAPARAKRALWACPEHARDVLAIMPGQPSVLERGWQLTGQG